MWGSKWFELLIVLYFNLFKEQTNKKRKKNTSPILFPLNRTVKEFNNTHVENAHNVPYMFSCSLRYQVLWMNDSIFFKKFKFLVPMHGIKIRDYLDKDEFNTLQQGWIQKLTKAGVEKIY